jgi:hypothetical protein
VLPRFEHSYEMNTSAKHTVHLSLNAWLFVLLLFYIGISPVYDFARVYLGIPQLGINLILFIGFVVWLVLKAFSGVSINVSRTYYLILFLLGIVSIYQIAAYPRVMGYGELSFLNYFTTMSFSIFFLVSGANIVKLYQVWNKPPWRKFCYMVYGFMLFAVVLAIINNGISYSNIIEKLIILPSGSDKSFNYLRFADSFAMFTIMLIAWEKKPLIRNCLIVCGLIVLFAVNSRTTFFLFVLVMVIFVFNRLNALLKAAIIAVILILLTMGNLSNIHGSLEGIASKYEGTSVHRMFRVIDLEKDSSYIARQRLLQEGWTELRQDWLFGKGYMGEAETLGKGSYIHNWLSFWYVYGFIPFILFCGLSIKLSLSTYTIWKKRKNDPLVNFVTIYSAFALLSIILARSYVYTNIWFCLAAMAAISHNYKELT